MSDGIITLTAQYGAGPKTLPIPISDVDTIEFNPIAFNTGPRPKAFGLGPPVPATTRPSPPKKPERTDAIELRGGGGERQPCKLVKIDEIKVQCEVPPGTRIDYSRKIVLRILIGGAR